ncbi:MAG: hypothetical protein V7785_21470 [Bermanella sp.]
MLSNTVKILAIILLGMLIYGTSTFLFPQDTADEGMERLKRTLPKVELVQEDVKISGTSIHVRLKISNKSDEVFPLYAAAIELKILEADNVVVDVCDNRPPGQIEPMSSKYLHFECDDLVFLEGKDSQNLNVEFRFN